MGKYSYSKLKLDQKKPLKPVNLSRQTGHSYFENEDVDLIDSAAYEVSSDLSSTKMSADSSIVIKPSTSIRTAQQAGIDGTDATNDDIFQ